VKFPQRSLAVSAIYPAACSAGPSAARSGIGIFRRELVAVLAVSLAAVVVLPSIDEPVAHIRVPGIPSKVDQAVVRWVVVDVTRLHAIWAPTDESLKYKPVQQSPSAVAQVNVVMT
jgi:hypothetical protein